MTFLTTEPTGTVKIEVSGATLSSATHAYSHMSPLIHPDTIQGLASQKFSTPGTETFVIKGYSFGTEDITPKVTVGPLREDGTRAEATIQENSFQKIVTPNAQTVFQLIITMPAGQGSDQDLIVWRGSQPSRPAKMGYHKPSVDAFVGDNVFPTKGGTSVTITGSNFGISGYVTMGTIKIKTDTQTHNEATFTVPAGEGVDLPLVVWAGDQSSIVPGADPHTISYQPPTLGSFSVILVGRRRRLSAAARRHLLATLSPSPSMSPSPSLSPSLSPLLSPSPSLSPSPPGRAVPSPGGGSTAVGSSCPTSLPTSSSGERTDLPRGRTEGGECIVIKGTNFGAIPARVFFGPFEGKVVARDEDNHAWLIVTSPAGEGAGLQLKVMVGLGDTSQNVTKPYAYERPMITSVSPANGSTSGMHNGKRVTMTIEGDNFGRLVALGVAKEVQITPPPPSASEEGVAAFVIRVTSFIEDSHKKLVFYMPEGYGQKAQVRVVVANQHNDDSKASNAWTFNYTKPVITKVTAYCGKNDLDGCSAPADKFNTDGCAEQTDWEDYTDWYGRTIGGTSPRRCGTEKNPRWQMAIIEGTSLGSYALAQAGADLQVLVSGDDEAPFVLATTKADSCAECTHTHTRIVALVALGYGRDLDLTVSLGASVSNPYPWNYKPPEITRIEASNNNAISAAGDGEVFLRGRNFGRTSNPAKMIVRVFIGYEYNFQDEAIGYVDGGGNTYDLAKLATNRTTAWGRDSVSAANMQGRKMKECRGPVKSEEGDLFVEYAAAQWHPSYDRSIPGARNVDGFPYITCTPQKDVSGPKNVTIVLGAQMDSCATNFRLCADPISWTDRRMKKPVEYCDGQALQEAQNGLVANTTAAASECRNPESEFCSWDCYSNSLFVGQCVSAEGQNSYGDSGQLCVDIDSNQAVCDGTDCMSLVVKEGFFRLTVNINCTRSFPDQPCATDANGAVDWMYPDGAARAMGTNTEELIPRCPVERWEPLIPPPKRTDLREKQMKRCVDHGGSMNPSEGSSQRSCALDPAVNYDEFEVALSTECYDIVSCHPKEACNGSNVCNENGYEYTYRTCRHVMEKNGIENTTCTTSDECRSMDKDGKFGGVKVTKGEARYNEPQAQSRCIKRLNADTGRVVRQCECFTSPRCSMCSVGSNWLGLKEGDKWFTEGFFRLNGKCEECPKNPGLLVGMFLGGMVLLCIGCWFLQKKDFNVAFISIGWDYFQVLPLLPYYSFIIPIGIQVGI